MPQRVPMPEPFSTAPFRVADALAAGLKAGRLRSPDLARPFHGLRVARRDVGAAPLSDAAHYAPLLRPGDRFSHTTAALLWDAPLPPTADASLHVAASGGLARPRSAGVRGHESTRPSKAVRSGLPCSDAVSTFLELATVLQLDDLVAVGEPPHPEPACARAARPSPVRLAHRVA